MTAAAPQTVYVHVGLHKTGTTFLQNVMRANRDEMRAQGVEFPGGPGEPVQTFAVWDLQGRRPRGVKDRRIAGTWDRLVKHVEDVDGAALPRVLISEERLSLCTLKQVRKVVDGFVGSEVHVIVTARDLGRVMVSAWQEEIKNDQTYTWREFAASIRDPGQRTVSPARAFWARQDLPVICELWESAVPAERIHVVTVPPSGSSPDELMRRFSSVVGFDPAKLTNEPRWNNESVGVAGTEVIRRVNERLGGRLNQREHDKVMKLTVVPMLARTTEPVRFALPQDDQPWVEELAVHAITTLGQAGYDVVGDLEDLRPRFREGSRRPDDATDAELLESALDALALLSEEYAKKWWRGKRASVEGIDEGGDVASKARGLVFRGQRRAAQLADNNRVAAKAMGLVLRRRERARARARSR